MNHTREDLAFLLLRLSGLMHAGWHGFGKVAALSSGDVHLVEGVAKLGFPAPLVFAWAAALAEAAGGILVAVGLWTRVAAFFTAVTMAVAAFGVHHAHQQIAANLHLVQIPEETLKAWGRPEMALLYLLVYLALILAGSGRFSLDGALSRRRRD